MAELQLDGARVVVDDDLLLDRVADRVAERVLEQGDFEPWLTVDEAARYLSAPTSRIYDLVSQRRVRFRKDGRRLLFRRGWLDETLSAESAVESG